MSNNGNTEEETDKRQSPGLWPLTAYFLKLGTIGFGGPPAW